MQTPLTFAHACIIHKLQTHQTPRRLKQVIFSSSIGIQVLLTPRTVGLWYYNLYPAKSSFLILHNLYSFLIFENNLYTFQTRIRVAMISTPSQGTQVATSFLKAEIFPRSKDSWFLETSYYYYIIGDFP